MKMDQGVVKVKKLCNNAKLPVRGTSGAAGYGLVAAQIAVVSAHGKVLVKTGLSISLPTWLLWKDSSKVRISLEEVH